MNRVKEALTMLVRYTKWTLNMFCVYAAVLLTLWRIYHEKT